MASLATCPQCAKQLAIPEGASSDDRAQCPECDATFLLSNAFQTSLPIARILEPIEASQTAEVPEPPPLETAGNSSYDIPTATSNTNDLDGGQPSSKAPSVASLASWESRLKNAIERDETELKDQNNTVETLVTKPRFPSPDFEFDLDPSPAEESLETENESSTEAEPIAAEFAVTAEESELTARLNALPAKRSRGFSPLRLAAVLIGPGFVGVVVGLYALLWIKGPSGDLLNLAQYLPEAVLPAMPVSSEFNASKEATPPTVAEDLLVAKSPPDEEQLEAEPADIHRDEEVRMAVAEQPAPQALRALPDIFGELLAAARTAMPALIEGDLSTNDAVSRKGKAYMAVCQLAQQFEAIRLPGLDAKSQAEAASAQELFDSVAANSSALSDLASITSRWWGYESRPNEGIFVVGRIRDTQPMGGRTLCYVMLDEPAAATIIPVLLDQPPGRDGDRVVVVGSIVVEPRNNLPNFIINMPQVVVAPYSRVLQP